MRSGKQSRNPKTVTAEINRIPGNPQAGARSLKNRFRDGYHPPALGECEGSGRKIQNSCG
jgi:hypothetical protein